MVQGVVIQDGFIFDINPATGELIDTIPVTTPEELSSLIQRATCSQRKWAFETTLDERIDALKRGCRALGEIRDQLAFLVTTEMGKPIHESYDEVDGACRKDELLELIRAANCDEELRNAAGDLQTLVTRHPYGVVACFCPWNFPVDEILMLILPALGAGNSVLVKPSEVTPLVGAATVQTLMKYLPDGVLQLVQGDGETGKLMCASNDIHMVAMTGSTETGIQIMNTCASSLKRLVLELGGKDPVFVFADADLELAARDIVKYSLSNSGQVCCSFERIYIDVKVLETFETILLKNVSSYVVGNGLSPETKVGPLASTLQRDRVNGQVQEALSKGARLLFQSSLPCHAPVGSSFYPVTVIGGITENMRIQQQETFGPVVALSVFDGSNEEAIRLANASPYGLASSIYTGSLERAKTIAKRITSGQCGINCYALGNAHVAAPWVGHKYSGFLCHSGIDGFRSFSLPKSIVFPPSGLI